MPDLFPDSYSETDLMRRLQKLATMLTSRLFRNNTGMAWQGKMRKNRDGSITLQNPRPLHAGLVVGGSDLIGWTPVRITQAMVGDTVAVFTAVEVKKGTKPSKEQEAFIEAVRKAGGYAGIARDDRDLTAILMPDLGNT
jgi:hypothetical protein